MAEKRIFQLLISLTALIYGLESEAENVLIEQPGTLTANVGMRHNVLNLELQSVAGTAPNVIYLPRSTSQLFVAATYGLVGLSVGMNATDQNTQQQETSRSQDIQLRFFGSRWSPEIFYQSYKGYQTTDSNNLTIFRSDLKAKHWGAQVFCNSTPEIYSFESHFSLRSRQIKSGGSWFAVGGFSRHSIEGESALGGENADAYGALGRATAIETSNLNFGIAGAYNWIYDNYFFGGLVGLAANYQNVEAFGSGTSSSKEELGGVKSHFRLGAGYNGEQLLTGAYMNVDGQSVKLEQSNLILDTIELKVFVGWRFDEPEIPVLKKINSNLSELITSFKPD